MCWSVQACVFDGILGTRVGGARTQCQRTLGETLGVDPERTRADMVGSSFYRSILIGQQISRLFWSGVDGVFATRSRGCALFSTNLIQRSCVRGTSASEHPRGSAIWLNTDVH